MKTAPPLHGTPAAYREFIHEMAQLAAIHAQLAMQHAEIGDDVALEYAVRRWVAHTKAAISTMADLKALRETGRIP
jgi:hypothetical protein